MPIRDSVFVSDIEFMELSCHSVANFTVSVEEEELRSVLTEANEEARSPDDTIELEVIAKITVSIREERSYPPVWELMPGARKIGCGSNWHYQSHVEGLTCQICLSPNWLNLNKEEFLLAIEEWERRQLYRFRKPLESFMGEQKSTPKSRAHLRLVDEA